MWGGGAKRRRGNSSPKVGRWREAPEGRLLPKVGRWREAPEGRLLPKVGRWREAPEGHVSHSSHLESVPKASLDLQIYEP
jgi:hypothetical protein